MVRHTSGFICASLEETDADRLELPPMYRDEDRRGMAYAVTVDARDGISTGVSAADRAHTVRLLADPGTRARDLTRPGHVVPMRRGRVGCCADRGTAAVDLVNWLVCARWEHRALVSDDSTMMRLPDLAAFAGRHGLALITIAIHARRRHAEQQVTQPRRRIPTGYGSSVLSATGLAMTTPGVALSAGTWDGGMCWCRSIRNVDRDAFRSLRCDCGSQLRAALRRPNVAGGRSTYAAMRAGIGCCTLAAYQRQDLGRDTVEDWSWVAGGGPGRYRRADPARPWRTDPAAADQQRGLTPAERYAQVVGRERLSVTAGARSWPLHESPSLSGPVR
jgi:3,4-dihydroxy 2-butanone 4-phosphate synthase/GTP cyclohydrolase II